ncbi:MAG: FKBP-type peptidyl-prolyl cis-trans isomerase [Pseudomonadales bacterium]|jgi:FKBP-type peptidyl-prolyl cis-trans isomerase|nr:FKBP-type peptidyl-prolyl cis-trans isomerase [Pseudomonadales bacterium]
MTTFPRLRSLAVALTVCASTAALAQTLDTPEKRAGYGMGVNIASTLASQGLLTDLDVDAMVAGIRDSAGGTLKLTEDEIMAALQALQIKKQQEAVAAMEAQAKAGRDFLAQNKTRKGVTTTASGLQYEVVTNGRDAKAKKPAETDTVKVHYHGTLIDGTVFDSSVTRNQPVSFLLNEVIPGWTEGLQLMKVGDKFKFFIPSELAYGDSGAGPIPPNSVLIFEVELLSIGE